MPSATVAAARTALAGLALVGGLGTRLVAETAADPDTGAPPAQGLDVGHAASQVRNWIQPGHPDKPWSPDIAELSTSGPGQQLHAIASLIRYGAQVLPDLTVLSHDQDPQLRVRVVEVASGIGGQQPAPLLLDLSHDPDLRVRQAAVLGLGRCRGPGVFERLNQALTAPDADERCAGAQALGATGDVRGLAPLSHLDQEDDDLAKRAMGEALQRIATQAVAVPELVRLLLTTHGPACDNLVRSCAEMGDPRLCPPLLQVASSASSPLTSWLALQALAHDGDSRAWQQLCDTAATAAQPELRAAAAASMRALTGSPGEGQAWTVWWQDHAASAVRQNDVDAMLATLHDPSAAIDRAELERFTVDELAPLVEGALGAGCPWWPARAFQVMAADQPQRWSAELTRRLLATGEPTTRLPLIILVDQLGGPSCLANLHRIQADLTKRQMDESTAPRGSHLTPDRGPELLALRVAFERHVPAP